MAAKLAVLGNDNSVRPVIATQLACTGACCGSKSCNLAGVLLYAFNLSCVFSYAEALLHSSCDEQVSHSVIQSSSTHSSQCCTNGCRCKFSLSLPVNGDGAAQRHEVKGRLCPPVLSGLKSESDTLLPNVSKSQRTSARVKAILDARSTRFSRYCEYNRHLQRPRTPVISRLLNV